MSREHSFPSKYITEVEKDGRRVLGEDNWRQSSSLGVLVDWVGPQEEEEKVAESLAVLQYVCGLVSERCAALASLCVAELCSRHTKVSLRSRVSGLGSQVSGLWSQVSGL